MFVELTKRQEKLLEDILEHRSENGAPDMSYWETRFHEVEGNMTEDALLRGTFGELQKEGMIKVCWADNIAYYIVINSAGITYFENKKDVEKSKRKSGLKQFGKDTAIGVVSGIASSFIPKP